MSDAPLVSVVVPTRNAERTLFATLESIGKQRGIPVEIVVVDKDSHDATPQIAREGADRVVNAGTERSAQRNHGAHVATGEILFFVDADMVLEPDVASEAAAALADPDVCSVVVPELAFGEGFWARCKALEKQMAMGDPAVEAARVFRRRDFEAVGGFDENLTACEDWDLSDRVAAAHSGTQARTHALIWHDEGHLRLRGAFAKKRYYGRWVHRWLQTAPSHRRRRRGPADGIAPLLRRPVTTMGLVVMKAVEAVGFAAGMRDAHREVP